LKPCLDEACLDEAISSWLHLGDCDASLNFNAVHRLDLPIHYLVGAISWYCGGPFVDKWLDELPEKSMQVELALADLSDDLEELQVRTTLPPHLYGTGVPDFQAFHHG